MSDVNDKRKISVYKTGHDGIIKICKKMSIVQLDFLEFLFQKVSNDSELQTKLLDEFWQSKKEAE